jgi:hypothetical protein
MSALASLAEFPGAIQNLFITKEYSRRGKYTVQIYDKPKEKWVKVSALFRQALVVVFHVAS